MSQTANIFVQNNIAFLKIERNHYCFDLRERPIGQGAMGTVYRGWNYQTQELVAIKQVKQRYADIPAIRARARQEAALKFRHRNLVEMLGLCEEHPGHGAMFIVSKWVNGVNIDDFVKRSMGGFAHDMRVKRICELIYPVLDALAFIHSHGVVHLDIKPSNIMVENGNNVRLMDLGIAYAETPVSGSSTTGLMGTPKYAAPEQFSQREMENTGLNARTDLYELGVTIYELITGSNPFECQTLQEIAEKHRLGSLPESALVPKPLMQVLQRATAPQQNSRFASAQEMRLAIEQSFAVHETSGLRGLFSRLFS